MIESGEIPAELLEEANAARTVLIDTLANCNDEILEKYLAEEPIEYDLIQKAIRQATIDNQVVPVISGSAFKNKGVQALLDAIVSLSAFST